MNPVPIQLPGLQARDKDMPVVISAVDGWIELDRARRLHVIFVIEGQQFDT